MEPEGVGYHIFHKILLFKPILSQQQRNNNNNNNKLAPLPPTSFYCLFHVLGYGTCYICDWQLHIFFLVPIPTK